MSRIRGFISVNTAVRIYKTMIRPHLEYVDFIIESGSKNLIVKIDRLQERALCRIEFSCSAENRKSYAELQLSYGIENLHKRRKWSLLGQMYGHSKKEINVVQENCDRILRSNRKVKMKYDFSNLTKLHNSPFYRGVKLWNTLPEDIQKCNVKREFKRRVRD